VAHNKRTYYFWKYKYTVLKNSVRQWKSTVMVNPPNCKTYKKFNIFYWNIQSLLVFQKLLLNIQYFLSKILSNNFKNKKTFYLQFCMETPECHQKYQDKYFSKKKSMFSTLKKKRSQKFVWGLPDGICRIDPKILKKLLKHIKSTNQNEYFPKKVCLVP
jgi:hypothetical protein